MSDFAAALPTGVTRNNQFDSTTILSSINDNILKLTDFMTGDSRSSKSNIPDSMDEDDIQVSNKKQNELLDKISKNTETLRKSGFEFLYKGLLGPFRLITEPLEKLGGWDFEKSIADGLGKGSKKLFGLFFGNKKVPPKRSQMLKTHPEAVYMVDELLGKSKKDKGMLDKINSLFGLGPGFLTGVIPGLVKGISKIGPFIAIGAAIGLMIKDGIKASKLADEWGVSKTSAVIGGVLGGTKKGLEGAFSNMGKWALLGAGAGTLIAPGLGTLIGGLIGAAFGGILGWIGGENISKAFEKFKTGVISFGNILDKLDKILLDVFDYGKYSGAMSKAGSGAVPVIGTLIGGVAGSAIEGLVWLFKPREGGSNFTKFVNFLDKILLDVFDYGKYSGAMSKSGSEAVPVIGTIVGGVTGSVVEGLVWLFKPREGGSNFTKFVNFLDKILLDVFDYGKYSGAMSKAGSEAVPVIGTLIGGVAGSAIEGLVWLFKPREGGSNFTKFVNFANSGLLALFSITPLGKKFSRFGSGIIPIYGTIVGGVIGTVIEAVISGFKIQVSLYKTLWGFVKDKVGVFFTGIKNILGDFFKPVTDKITSFIESENKWEWIKDEFKELGKKIFGGIIDKVDSYLKLDEKWEWVKEGVGKLVSGIMDFVNSIFSFFDYAGDVIGKEGVLGGLVALGSDMVSGFKGYKTWDIQKAGLEKVGINYDGNVLKKMEELEKQNPTVVQEYKNKMIDTTVMEEYLKKLVNAVTATTSLNPIVFTNGTEIRNVYSTVELPPSRE